MSTKSKTKQKKEYDLFDKFYKKRYGEIPKVLGSFESENYEEMRYVYSTGFKAGKRTLRKVETRHAEWMLR